MLSSATIQEVIDRARTSDVSQIGGNSTITHVVLGNHEYAVKDYSARLDGAQRLATEFAALELLNPWLPGRFAEPLGIGADGTWAVHSWIPGRRPPLDSQTVSHMLTIASELHQVSGYVEQHQMKAATDQVLTIGDVVDQLRSRIDNLMAAPALVAEFTRFGVLPVTNRLGTGAPLSGRAVMTLSPSDFGAHNLLWDEGAGMMHCVDLEFFGWDDAHKLTCDTLLHPLSRWTEQNAEAFLTGALDIYQLNEQRLLELWPWLNVKWATIALARAARNLRSGQGQHAAQALVTAQDYVGRSQESGLALNDIVLQVSNGRRGP